MKKETKTIRLIYPQWQGANIVKLITEVENPNDASRGYFLGAQLLNFLAPDNGQETLATILDTLFVSYPNVERRIDFDHKKKRLFQVSDMLTVIDKLDYKRKNNIPFTKAEKYFFSVKDILGIIRQLKSKRL